MAVYDLEEQEKIDELKAWWKRWGNTVIAAVTGFVIVFAGIQTWRHYQRVWAAEAATLFATLETTARGTDAKKVAAEAKAIIEKYPRTAYAPRAALLAAKAQFDAGDLAGARAQLEWVAGNAKEDALRELARLRLAGVLGDEKKFDEALRVLDAIKDENFAPAAAGLRGDLLVAQGKKTEARSAYQAALAKSDPAQAQSLQRKLDALGEGKQ